MEVGSLLQQRLQGSARAHRRQQRLHSGTDVIKMLRHRSRMHQLLKFTGKRPVAAWPSRRVAAWLPSLRCLAIRAFSRICTTVEVKGQPSQPSRRPAPTDRPLSRAFESLQSLDSCICCHVRCAQTAAAAAA